MSASPSDPSREHAHLFVYGTLRPGDVRWSLLEPFVDGDGIDDAVPGSLFDTGLDYPAAIFDIDPDGQRGDGERGDRRGGVIHGRTYRLRAESLDRALVALDEEEDTVLGLYRRVTVTTASGVTAWAYAYGDGLELSPIPSGDWFRR